MRNRIIKLSAKYKNSSEFINKSVIAFTLKIIGITSSYLFAYLVSKHYGAKAWGVFSLAITCALFGILIGKMGFDTALLKFTAEYDTLNKRSIVKNIFFKVIKFLIPLCFLLTFLLHYFSQKIANGIFNKPMLGAYVALASLMIVPYVGMLINSEGLRGLKQTTRYVFLQNVSVYLFASCLLLINFQFLIFQDNDFLPLKFFNSCGIHFICVEHIVVG